MEMVIEPELFGGVSSTEGKIPPVVKLLRIYADKGKTLAWCANPKIIKLSLRTLKNIVGNLKYRFLTIPHEQ